LNLDKKIHCQLNLFTYYGLCQCKHQEQGTGVCIVVSSLFILARIFVRRRTRPSSKVMCMLSEEAQTICILVDGLNNGSHETAHNFSGCDSAPIPKQLWRISHIGSGSICLSFEPTEAGTDSLICSGETMGVYLTQVTVTHHHAQCHRH
jgi:hypothetical protein